MYACSGITSTQLHALIAVVEAGAFARAARRTGRARTAVHRAARQLEKSLGTALFEVTSFGVRPTREAEKLVQRIRLAFAEIAQAQAEVAAARGAGSGFTIIGAMPLARSVLVARAVLEFAAVRPEHGISILDGPYESMLKPCAVAARTCWLGRCAIRFRTTMSCRSTCLTTRLRSSWGRSIRSRAAARRRWRRWHAFPGSPLRRNSPLRRHFDALIARLEGQRAVAPIECNSLVAARSMLVASDRVMLLSEHQIHHELATGQLLALPHPFGAVTRSIGLTVRRDWRPTEVQAQLIAGLRRHARTAPARG